MAVHYGASFFAVFDDTGFAFLVPKTVALKAEDLSLYVILAGIVGAEDPVDVIGLEQKCSS